MVLSHDALLYAHGNMLFLKEFGKRNFSLLMEGEDLQPVSYISSNRNHNIQRSNIAYPQNTILPLIYVGVNNDDLLLNNVRMFQSFEK
jgi:hypothetical protein